MEKQNELKKKELEGHDIKAQHHEYVSVYFNKRGLIQAVKQLKNEEQEFKKFLGDNYVNQMIEQKQKEQAARQQKLEEERIRQEQIQKVIQEEKMQKLQQKMQMKQEAEKVLQSKEAEKNMQKEAEVKKKEEVNKLMAERTSKEKEREEQYRKFFKDFDRIMQTRTQTHIESVSNIETQKSMQRNDWIRKNEQEYQEKLKEKEQKLNEWRHSVSFIQSLK